MSSSYKGSLDHYRRVSINLWHCCYYPAVWLAKVVRVLIVSSLATYLQLHVFTRDEKSREIDVPSQPLLPPLNHEELKKLIQCSD